MSTKILFKQRNKGNFATEKKIHETYRITIVSNKKCVYKKIFQTKNTKIIVLFVYTSLVLLPYSCDTRTLSSCYTRRLSSIRDIRYRRLVTFVTWQSYFYYWNVNDTHFFQTKVLTHVTQFVHTFTKLLHTLTKLLHTFTKLLHTFTKKAYKFVQMLYKYCTMLYTVSTRIYITTCNINVLHFQYLSHKDTSKIISY